MWSASGNQLTIRLVATTKWLIITNARDRQTDRQTEALTADVSMRQQLKTMKVDRHEADWRQVDYRHLATTDSVLRQSIALSVPGPHGKWQWWARGAGIRSIDFISASSIAQTWLSYDGAVSYHSRHIDAMQCHPCRPIDLLHFYFHANTYL